MLQCGSTANDPNAFTIRVTEQQIVIREERLRVTTAGNMGVGNADKTRLVAQTASGMSVAVKDNTGASISLGGVTQPRVLLEAGASASEFIMYTAGGSSYGSPSWAERLRVTSDGKMGVGCTPEVDFQVRNANGGTLKIGGSGTGATGFQIQYNNSGNTTTEILTNYRATSGSA